MEVSVPYRVALGARGEVHSSVVGMLDDIHELRASGQDVPGYLRSWLKRRQELCEAISIACFGSDYNLEIDRQAWERIEEIGLTAYVLQEREKEAAIAADATPEEIGLGG